ncbi:MAG: pyridoxal-dependent decarboxylase, exosortase A system-associated [Nocardioides sp.]
MTPEQHLAGFGTADHELAVGGIPLGRLTARVGSTPYFAYDRAAMTRRVAELREAIGASVDLGYAVKANPMPAVVQHLAGHVDSLDVASAGEMTVALDSGMPAERISFAGPGKTDEELRRAVAAGVLVELESEGEARRLSVAGEALGLRPRVAVRINPDFAVKGSGMRMGGGPQQFGVDVEQAPALMDLLTELDLGFEGFHLFAGSQNLRADILAEAQIATVSLLLALADKAPSSPTYLNLGGGFGIPYFEKDRPLDLARVGENLRHLADDILLSALPHARVVVELGRFLVGEAGVYVTRVVDRKVSRGRTYLVVDGGMHHQLAASGNLGQVIRRNYPLAVGNRIAEQASDLVTVVGCLCTPLDVLGDDVTLPRADVGDLVVVFQAGAYGYSASPLNFLGHPAPAEVLV